MTLTARKLAVTWERGLWTILAILWFVLVYPALIIAPSLPSPGLDAAWRFLMTFGALHHLQWGRNFDFTFGPLAYVSEGAFLPQARVPMLTYALALPAVELGLCLALIRATEAWPIRLLVPITIAVMATNTNLLLCVVLAVAVAISRKSVARPYTALAIGLLTGFAALVKTDLILDCGAVYVLTLAFSTPSVAHRVRAAAFYLTGLLFPFLVFFDANPAIAATKLAAAVAAAILTAVIYTRVERTNVRSALRDLALPAAAGFSIAGLAIVLGNPIFLHYLGDAWELLHGYSSAMSVTGDPWSAIAGIILGLVWLATLSGLAKDARGFGLGVALVVFLAFKHGFVRADLHDLGYFALLAVAGCAVLVLLRRSWQQYVCFGLVVSAVAAMTIIEAAASFGSPFSVFNPASGVTQVRYFAQLATESEAGAMSGLAPLRMPAALRSSLRPGAVAALPWELEIPVVNNVAPAFAPIPQLYTAYTPPLDLADRDWLLQSDAPENVLYRFLAIDGRYVFAEAPATSVAMWCRYRWVAAGTMDGAEYSLFSRTPNLCSSPTVAERGTVSWGEGLTLPAVGPGEAFRIRYFIKKNAAGDAADLLWKLDPVTIRVSGAEAGGEYRILPDDAMDGILVQPMMQSGTAVRSFFGAGVRAAAISVELHTAYPWLYQRRVGVVVERLTRAAPSIAP